MATVCTRPDVARFHFLDETGLRLDYMRRYARARVGSGWAGPYRCTRGKSLTLIGALSVKGLGAVQVLEGALNQHRFAWYVSPVSGPHAAARATCWCSIMRRLISWMG